MKTGIITIALLIVSGISCKKVDKLTKFNMDYNQIVTIPASTGINLPFNILTPDITSNSEATFASNDTRKDLIEEIKLTKMALTVQSPPDGDFNFAKSVSIYISAPGMAETRVAWKENIPNTKSKIMELEVTGADLQEYIKQDKFTLRLNTVTDEWITSDYKINVHSTFFVDARILGQ